MRKSDGNFVYRDVPEGAKKGLSLLIPFPQAGLDAVEGQSFSPTEVPPDIAEAYKGRIDDLTAPAKSENDFSVVTLSGVATRHRHETASPSQRLTKDGSWELEICLKSDRKAQA